MVGAYMTVRVRFALDPAPEWEGATMAVGRPPATGRVATYGRLWLGLWWWAWLATWGALAALGLLLSARMWSPSTVLGVAAGAGSLAVACSFLVDRAQLSRPPQIAQVASVAVRRALVAGGASVALCLLLSVFGALVWPMLVLCAVSSPWVVRRALGRERRQRRTRMTRDRPPDCQRAQRHPLMAASAWVPAVRILSTEELCTSWRASYTIVRQATASDTRVELVSFRQACLDEMERRDPRGLHAWLDSGARAAGNPARFLSPQHPL